MKLHFYKRFPLGKRLWLNFSRSGVSVSARIGRLTLNSKGRKSLRLFPGVSLRASRRR